MLLKTYLFLILLCLGQTFGIIYHLNDTEYERLPPLFELENYESCMQSSGGIYCVASLQLYADSQNELYTLIQEYSEHSLKHYNYSNIDRGICVTRTCRFYAKKSGLDINREPASVLEGCLNETMRNKYDLMARIYNINCEKQADINKIHIDQADYLILIVFITILMFTLVGSYSDIYSNENKAEQVYSKGKELLLCFSVTQNFNKLITTEISDPRLNVLKGLHGIRTLAICLVIYAHILLLISGGFTSDPHTFEKAYDNTFHRITLSGLSVVQIFFSISGFFLTYFLQIFSEKRNVTWRKLPEIIFQRWWRLTPSAAIVIAFMATWMRHLSHGPLWNALITNGPTEQCRRFFWAHLLYFNNYLPEDTLCAFQTWHIAADMQLFLVGILVHFLIKNRSKKFKIITLTSILLVGVISPAVHVWLQDLDALVMQKPELYRTINDPTFRKYHVLGHNNLPAFIIGMAAGYWIYHFQQKSQNNVDYSNFKIGNFLCWCVIPTYIFVIYCGSLFFYDGDRPSLLLRMLYAATNRAIIGIINSFWIIGIILKFNKLSSAIMEWSGWVIPSKLSYSVFLLHNIFIHILLGVRTQLTIVSFLNVFFTYIGVVVVSFMAALPLYLLVEAPTARLIKVIVNEKVKKKSD